MSLGVTKECFPPANKCHNCTRKYRDQVTEKKDCGELKRCSSCHLMTYCDVDCQKEHWNAVHKRHCKFLSGTKLVANSRHDSVSCTFCNYERKASRHEIVDVNSPRTICHIEKLLIVMKMQLGSFLGFHEEGRTCGCSLVFACNLPFSVGEVSGQYIGPGVDEIVAHAIRLVHAMCIKKKSETVNQYLSYLVEFRSILWRRHLILGESARPCTLKVFPDILKDLEKLFGSNNPWWKALKFSLDIIAHVDQLQHFNNIVTGDLENPRLQNMKKVYHWQQPQRKSALLVSQNKLWANFKLWPTLNGGLLAFHLPAGIRCDSCDIELKGDVSITAGHVAHFSTSPPLIEAVGSNPTSPLLIATVGSGGGLVALCSTATNPSCRLDYITKLPKVDVVMDEFAKEWNLFLTDSRVCDVCIRNSLSAHRCSQCLASQYCSTQCQMKDLDFHKTVCADWTKDENRKMMSSSQQKKAFKSHVIQVSCGMSKPI